MSKVIEIVNKCWDKSKMDSYEYCPCDAGFSPMNCLLCSKGTKTMNLSFMRFRHFFSRLFREFSSGM